MRLPETYRWLEVEPGPRMLREALALYGTKERAGSANNPEILRWAEETGQASVYNADSMPWCGLFVAVCAKRAEWEPVRNPLWALNWVRWEAKAPWAGLGDVLVFVRDGGGHVGLYVGEDSEAFHVLGGNQGDSVSIVRIAKKRLVGVRRPKWRVAQPEGVKRVQVSATGVVLSTNEQ